MKKTKSYAALLVSVALVFCCANTLFLAQNTPAQNTSVQKAAQKIPVEEVKLAFVVDIAIGDDFEQGIKDTVAILKKRLKLIGARKKAKVLSRQDGLIVVLVKDPNDRDMVEKLFSDPGELEFFLVINNPELFKKVKAGSAKDSGCKIVYQQQGPWRIPYLVSSRVLMTGRDIESAAEVADEESGHMHVDVVFNPLGARQLTDITQRHIDEQIAVLYDGSFCSAPLIGAKSFNGQFRIDGDFSPEQAKRMSVVLASGALPYPLRLVRSPEAVLELARKMGHRFKQSKEEFKAKRKAAMVAAQKASAGKALKAQNAFEKIEKEKQLANADTEQLNPDVAVNAANAANMDAEQSGIVETQKVLPLNPVSTDNVRSSTPAQNSPVSGSASNSVPLKESKKENSQAPAASGTDSGTVPVAVLAGSVAGNSSVPQTISSRTVETVAVPVSTGDEKKNTDENTGSEEPGENFPRQSRDGPVEA